jgi:hypothetical protein
MIPVLPPVTTWWWVGYTDSTRAKGRQALGAVIIKHAGPEHHVAAELIRRGLAPVGGQPLFGRIALEWGDPPKGFEGRLLDAAEAEALAKAWDPGHGGLAGAGDIKEAFLDDHAKDGDPLFRRGPK